MLNFLSKALALLPLRCVHAIGTIVGKVLFLASPNSTNRLKENLLQSGIPKNNAELQRIAKANINETGKSILEALAIWQLPEDKAVSLVDACHGWQHVEQALAQGKGIIFLTPHLGCYEITSVYYASKHPITVLFRPSRQSWLNPLILKGRTKGQVKLAPANASGVRLLMQALKKGEAIGILPDQTPVKGEGEWAPFFGKTAYTMGLASKLAEKTGAQVIMAFGKRLAKGEGFEIHLTLLENGAIATPSLLNQALEQQIAQCPEQYLWSYSRYKITNQDRPTHEK